MEITIRRAIKGDNIRIRPLQKEIADLHHNGRPDMFRTEARYYSDEVFSQMLNDPDQFIYIAESGDVTVGYAFTKILHYRNHSTYIDFDMFYIDDICVLEQYRCYGMGKLLFDKCREQAIKSNCKTIDLGVWSFNKNAIAFYEKCGLHDRLLRMEELLPEKELDLSDSDVGC